VGQEFAFGLLRIAGQIKAFRAVDEQWPILTHPAEEILVPLGILFRILSDCRQIGETRPGQGFSFQIGRVQGDFFGHIPIQNNRPFLQHSRQGQFMGRRHFIFGAGIVDIHPAGQRRKVLQSLAGPGCRQVIDIDSRRDHR